MGTLADSTTCPANTSPASNTKPKQLSDMRPKGRTPNAAKTRDASRWCTQPQLTAKPKTSHHPGGASQIPNSQSTNRPTKEHQNKRPLEITPSLSHKSRIKPIDTLDSTPAGTLKQRREEHIEHAKGRGATATDKAAATPNRPRPHSIMQETRAASRAAGWCAIGKLPKG